jgi:hypothetical protein
MRQIKVSKSVPIPSRIKGQRPSASAYPFHRCEPGHSFAVPAKESRKLRTAIQHRRRWHGERYITQTRDGMIRCWRVDGLPDES